MNEMIERLAKSLWDYEQSKDWVKYGISNEILYGEHFKDKSVPWEFVTSKDVIPSIAEEFREKARVIVKAMREPTEEMVDAGYDDVNSVGCEVVWQSMIDEILK